MKNIVLCIDDDKIIPECIINFSPEENYLMMLIGSTYIVNGVSGIASIIHKEKLDEKIKEIDTLQNEIEIQKKYFKEEKENLEKNKKEEFENLTKIKMENKDLIIVDLQKQIEMFSSMFEKKNNDILHTKEKLDAEFSSKMHLLEAKQLKDKEFFDKERERNERTFEKLQEMLQSTTSKTSVTLGIEGENMFNCLAEKAFRDFEQFHIKDVSKESSKGDYHLFFKEFSVLVDTKNYLKTNVNNTSKKKLKVDIENNKHIPIAWLISLQGNINGFNKYPIMFEFVEDQCIFYINNLLKYQEPVEMLRLIWSVSHNIYMMLSKREAKQEDFQMYKTKVLDIVKELDAINRDENTMILDMTKNIEKLRNSKKLTKDFLNDLLNENINVEINTEYENILEENVQDSVAKWCSLHLVETTKEEKLKYNDLWDKYNKDISNKRYSVKKNKLKEYLLEIYKDHCGKNGDLQGITWQTI